MSLSDKNASERKFQEDFVGELKKYKWKAPDELNGNLQRVTVDDLIDHWRGELNRINQDQLEGVPLTDAEFDQVMVKVKAINNSYEAAKLLAIEESKGKVDGIYRDPHPDVTRKQITLTIFEKAQVSGGDSSYTIAREVVSNRNSKSGPNRFDIILLINGLPLINIEQKRTDKSLDEAFDQFKRYYREGEFTNNFMAFSQMMVISSEIATRYFATPKSLQDFNKSFVFNWADKANKPINDYKEVAKEFLMIPMAHQMVGDYLVIDEAENEEDQRHMLMRSYQVHALQAIEKAALGYGYEGIPHGGYIWHTTGSGKTITSFKTALFLATRANFDKIVFLVDRRELDSKTSENFKAYAAYEPVAVDSTPHTYRLKQELKTSKSGIVVTTTFKLHSLVKELIDNQDHALKSKKMVFIIDEAHRTTMGDMMGTIKSYFRENSLFYGFTGTPIFDENKVTGKISERSEVINTTEKLFGPLLHEYTIDQAIADGNVLGFNVDYINTGEFESYDQLREDLVEAMQGEKPNLSKRDLEREILQLSPANLEEKAKNQGILVYQDETHIPQVVQEILDHWEDKSRGREFNAILTVAYKHRVIAYYHEFKQQMQDMDKPLNVAMTFSFGDENTVDNQELHIKQEMFQDYSKFTGIEFSIGDKLKGEDAYFEDIVSRSTRGGSGRNPKNIDLVIVADQLLTGFDSKRLNTLYVDRHLALQNLIQAYSRTNRIYGPEKEFGSVVNFLYPALTEEAVNKALELYGSGGKSTLALVEPYDTAVVKLNQSISSLVEILPDPTNWQSLKQSEDDQESFFQDFRAANKQLNTVMQYYQYEWDDQAFGIDQHAWLRYQGAYKNLQPDTDDGEEELITPTQKLGQIKLVANQVIDAQYILKLIGDKSYDKEGVQYIDDESLRIIYQQIQELSDLGEDDQAQLLKQFVEEELVSRKVKVGIPFDQVFEAWKANILKRSLNSYAEKWGVDSMILRESFSDYDYRKPDAIPYLTEMTNSMNENQAIDKEGIALLKYKKDFGENVQSQFKEMKRKFD